MRIAIRLLVIISVLMVILSAVSWAGEKDELSWKAKALLSEVKRTKAENDLAQAKLLEFAKELDTKGYQLFQDGSIAEKPKPKPPEAKESPKK